jgi:hypothetical protein
LAVSVDRGFDWVEARTGKMRKSFSLFRQNSEIQATGLADLKMI